ncbi:hypothetical protein LMOSLCC2482_1338 [Listeria monocytogenes serotype 7 str. SLCC2482]|nr:hypothetical protein LMOSLCC2482_1338 [Listeria monocytogenes serotype 7 str. SLCC2482]CBY48884.1 hypothetical protein LMOSLCC2755_1292 [Listeria monocytogenes SLCC2755]CBY75981.1 hypothetical protein LMOSLCC2540_1340 [Listeria monocytogenes SLCC2540]
MKTSIVKSTQTEKLVPTTIAVVGFIVIIIIRKNK